jgi:hypothetical protein
MFSRSSPPSFNISTLDDEAMFHGYKVLGLFDEFRWRSRGWICYEIDREYHQSIAEFVLSIEVSYSEVTQDFELGETHNLFLAWKDVSLGTGQVRAVSATMVKAGGAALLYAPTKVIRRCVGL